MMKLEEGALAAAPAVGAHERAAAVIPGADGPLHHGRDVSARGLGLPLSSQPSRFRELLSRELFPQRGQCPIEDLRRITVRDGVPEQVLDLPELLA
ncbi:MAG TPA: hypothetical protein VF310_16090, partial [Vicinamibacteria bacterium]